MTPSPSRPTAPTSASARRRLATIAVGAGLAFALLLPGYAAGAQKAIWGPAKLPDGTSAMPTYALLGVDVFQVQLNWAQVAPQRPLSPADPADPAYRWPSTLAATIAEADVHGIAVAVMVRATPPWAVDGATADRATGTLAPSQPRDYADFVAAASRRYPAVSRWMIWGEPNSRLQWTSGPTAYADVLDAAYGTLKSVDPADVVVGGMSFAYGETPPAAWIAALRQSDGRRPRLDEYGHNPFTRRCPDLRQPPDLQAGTRDVGDLDTLIGEVRAAFGPATRLWLSEFTVSSDRPSWALDFWVDRAQQADWLERAFAIAGATGYVTGIGWFNLRDGPEPDGLTTGLMTYAGERKPAFDAYRAARLDGSAAVRPCPGLDPAASPPSSGDLTTSLADATAPAASPPAAGAAYAEPPSLTVRAAGRPTLRAVVSRGYRMRLRCDRPCTVDAWFLAAHPGQAREPRRRRSIAHAWTWLEAGEAGGLTLRLDPRIAQRARAPVHVTLALAVRDLNDGVRRLRRPLTLR